MSETFGFEHFIASIEGWQEHYAPDIGAEQFFQFPTAPILDAENNLLSESQKSIAYFSMEYGIAPSIYNSFHMGREMKPENTFFKHDVFSNYWLCDYLFKVKIDKMLDIPIYGGGLGVLAGDTMKSIADIGLSVVGIGILWNKGYFKQNFWYKHGQVPEELQWDPRTYPGLIPLKTRIEIPTREGTLLLRLWKYYIFSFDKKTANPIILLDSNLPENPDHFRKLTDQLYRSDHSWWKIFQRVILGVGGVKAIRKLGYHIHRYHLNEGHAAFAFLEQCVSLDNASQTEELKKQFVYTCHTPVAAGHDRFSVKDLANVLDKEYVAAAEQFAKESPQSADVNLTFLCLDNCSKVNAVSEKHGEVMRVQFPKFARKIKSITNGVHMHTWISQSFEELFDSYPKTFGDWKREPENLRRAAELREDQKFRQDLFLAHQKNKGNLMSVLRRWRMKEDIFTLGWARRIAGYKRPSLIFHDSKRLARLAHEVGPIQIIMAGKAHPNDNLGGVKIDEILNHIDQLNEHRKVIRVMILENYDTYFGKLMTNSVDVWLNNPLPPFEASGTSGMKAIINGVLQLSTLDGWVVEARQSDIGWFFGYQPGKGELGRENDLRLEEDSDALYDNLEQAVRLYYDTFRDKKINLKSSWIDKMVHSLEMSAYFNTQRMVRQYEEFMWGQDNTAA